MKSMYIFKNALRNVSKSKGRNILIGIIVFIISFAACVSLSIQAASDDAAREAMEELDITPIVTPIRGGTDGARPVSYTHLDVYKRQHCGCATWSGPTRTTPATRAGLRSGPRPGRS